MSTFFLPSPIHELESTLISENQLRVFVKRDDLIHSEVSGNKWRKLKYNIEKAKLEGFDTILTFGGAYSNHLLATAVAGKIAGLKTIAVIRGERVENLSDTLRDCEKNGMLLHFISRSEYRNKNDSLFIETLKQKFGQFFLVPEGGANQEGVQGCEEILSEVDLLFDYVACSAGTGTTAVGVLKSMNNEKLLVFPALKGIDFMKEEIFKSIQGTTKVEQVKFFYEYHFGGYAKANAELVQFVRDFYEQYKIKLDLIYTAKLFFGVFDLIKEGYFAPNSKILLIHTGGLQGNRGMEKRLGYSLF